MLVYSQTLINYQIFINFSTPYIDANGVDLGISIEQHDRYLKLPKIIDGVMEPYLNPSSYGPVNTKQANAVYADSHLFTRGIQQLIKVNPANKLTPMDYMMLDIHEDLKPHKNTLPPAYRIGIVCKHFGHLNNIYQIFDIENLTHDGKPPLVKRMKVKMLVLSKDAPVPSLTDLKDIDSTTTMIFDTPFTDDQIDKIAYLAVCFSNDAGDGDYSAILASAII